MRSSELQNGIWDNTITLFSPSLTLSLSLCRSFHQSLCVFVCACLTVSLWLRKSLNIRGLGMPTKRMRLCGLHSVILGMWLPIHDTIKGSKTYTCSPRVAFSHLWLLALTLFVRSAFVCFVMLSILFESLVSYVVLAFIYLKLFTFANCIMFCKNIAPTLLPLHW